MENVFNILKEYHDLDTSLKKDAFINKGLKSRSWKEISFNAIVEDVNSESISVYPISDKEEKLSQMIFIKYYRKDFIQLNKFPIAKKEDVEYVTKLHRFEKIKGIATISEISPIIYLKLKTLER